MQFTLHSTDIVMKRLVFTREIAWSLEARETCGEAERSDLVRPRVVDELDPHLAAPRVEAVERVELRELELGLVGAARCKPVAAERAPEQRDVAAHLGAGRAQGEARASGSGY